MKTKYIIMPIKKFNEYIKEDNHPTYEHDNIIVDIKNEIENKIREGMTNDEIEDWMESYPVNKNELIHVIRMYMEQVNR